MQPEVIHKTPTAKEKQLIKEANDRIKLSLAEQSRLVVKAQNFFAR